MRKMDGKFEWKNWAVESDEQVDEENG